MTATTPQRAQEMLGDIAERAYALACRLSDDAMAAEDAEARGRLAGNFQTVARAVRQTLAWQARLARDEARAEREAGALAAEAVRARVEDHRGRVSAAVTRMIHDETPGFKARLLCDSLRVRLDEAQLDDGFLDESVEAHVARVSELLGLFRDAGGAPQPGASGLSPAVQARIDDLLSALPDEADEDDIEDEDEDPDTEGRERRPPAGIWRHDDGG